MNRIENGNKSRSVRRAFTLVELVAVLGCLTIITGVAIVLLFQMFDMQSQCEERSDWTRSTNRFTDVFRRDVHELGKPELQSDPDEKNEILLRWQSKNSVVEYELHKGEYAGQQIVRRIEKTDKEIRRTEDYRLPDRSDIRFFEGKDKHSGLVALSLWKHAPGMDIPKTGEMNPFERTLAKSFASQDETGYAGIWRTVLARYENETQTGGSTP